MIRSVLEKRNNLKKWKHLIRNIVISFVSLLLIFFSNFSKVEAYTTGTDANNQKTYSFSSQGGVEEWPVPTTGKYKLEVWGAQGIPQDSHAGLGGYSTGEVNLTMGTSLYIYVGGKNGYNGGGSPYSGGSGTGGGGTDIRTTSNTTYADRIIVAGGGGGGADASPDSETGGYGGGLTGGTGTATGGGAGNISPAPGGTQTSAGPTNVSGSAGGFGYGGNGGTYGGGAGGGWYGGSGGSNGGGGGGSGYVLTSSSYKPSGYNPLISYYLSNAQTIAGNQSFPAPGGWNETGHSGNGYARITQLNTPPTIDSLSSPTSGATYLKKQELLPIVGKVTDDKAGSIQIWYRIKNSSGTVVISDAQIGSVPVNANTSTDFSYITNGVNLNVPAINATGTYTVEVWGVDSQGGVGQVTAISTKSITIKLNTPPIINSLSLPSGTYNKRQDKLPIEGNVIDDKDGSVQIWYRMKNSSDAEVISQTQIGSVNVAADTATAFSYIGASGVNLSAISAITQPGTYTVEVWGVDSEGAAGPIRTNSITINVNSPPTIDSIISPNSTDVYMSSNKLPIIGSVTDDTTGNVQIWYKIIKKSNSAIAISQRTAGTVSVTTNTSTSFGYEGATGIDISSISNSDTYTLLVWGVDSENAAGLPVSIDFTVKANGLPVIDTLTSPNSTSIYMTSNKLPIMGSVTDDKAGNVQIWYRISRRSDGIAVISDTQLGSVTVPANSSTSFSYIGTSGVDISTISSADTYKIEVWGIDADGGVGTPNTQNFSIGLNSPPTINSITSPTSTNTYMNTDKLPITGSVTDDKNGSVQIWYRIKNSVGTEVIPPTQLGNVFVNANTAYNFSYTGTSGANIIGISTTGIYTVEILGIDSDGGIGILGINNINIKANSPPTINSITSPASASTYMNTNNISITGNVTDDKTGNIQLWYRIKNDSGTVLISDKQLGSEAAVANTAKSFSYAGIGISTITASGTYKLEVWGKDSDGAVGAPYIQNFNISVNRPPIINGLTSPTSTGRYISTNKLTITGTVTDDRAGSVQIWYRIKNSDGTVISDTPLVSAAISAANAAKNFTNSGVDISALTATGQYTLEVWGVDSQGGVGGIFSRSITIIAGMNDSILDIEIKNPPATPFDVYYVFKFKKIDPKTPLSVSDKAFENQATIIPVKADGTIGTIIQKALQLKIRDALMNLQ